jgi:hypothetical protein
MKEIDARWKVFLLQKTWTYFKGMPFEEQITDTEEDEWNRDAQT